MPPSGPLLDRARIERLLGLLGRGCASKGFSAELFLVGGAAMVMAYRRDRSTRDLDAVFEPKMPLYEEAARIAREEGLPPDWLNDAVKGMLPDAPDAGARTAFEAEGISVAVASPEYLFAMKALSARQEGDSEDFMKLAEILGIRTPEEAFAVVERFYDPQRLTAKASIFVQSLLGAADYGRAPEPNGHPGEVYVKGHIRRGGRVAPYWRRGRA